MRAAVLLCGLALARIGWAQCETCHAEIARNYARTGMGRSFREVTSSDSLPEFNGTSFQHAASGQRFIALRRDGNYNVRRSLSGPDGKDVNVLEVRVDYVMGSGNHARSYLHRTPDDKLVQFPVSWYPENGGYWAMSPGYDRPGHEGFSREISYRCMFCHNGYPVAGKQADLWDGATEFPRLLPGGIDCQRCHGPGASHVEAARRGRSLQAVRAAIVNPSRLSPERRMEVCLQCHLETTSSPLPGALMRFGRGVFSYNAGEPLGDYMQYFDHAPGTGHEGKFEIVSSAYRLRQSPCFQSAGGKLGCTSCHDPHRAATREETARKSQVVCQSCHAAARSHSEGRDCVACHMPKRRAEDVKHAIMTDHRIGARADPIPAPERAVEHDISNTLPYSGRVAPYYPAQAPPLSLALAQVKQMANISEGLAQLEKSLATASPREARAYYEMGQALLGAGQAARAVAFFEEAVKREPEEWRHLFGLGQASRDTGAFERALKLAPSQTSILYALGDAYISAGNLGLAAVILRRALERNPESAAGMAQMGNLLLRQGDIAGAESALREAVRQRPESVAYRINFAAALIAGGKLAEGRGELEQAIGIGPLPEVARTAWFQALASGGSVQQARARYDASLRSQLAGAHANLGTVHSMQGGHAAAVREFQLALSADPDLAQAHQALGEILIAAGEVERGKTHLQRAAELRSRIDGSAKRP